MICRRIAKVIVCMLIVSLLATSVCAMSIAYPNFNSIEEYEAFIEREELPDGFVRMENFAALGEFYFGTMQSSDNTECFYSYINENGFRSSVSVKPSEEKNAFLHTLLESAPDGESMCKIPETGERMDYVRNGVRFAYSGGGELISVEWRLGGKTYTISSGSGLSNYPIHEEDTLLKRLLSVEDPVFQAAFQELTASLGEELQMQWREPQPIDGSGKGPDPMVVLAVVSLASVITLSVVLLILYKRGILFNV